MFAQLSVLGILLRKKTFIDYQSFTTIINTYKRAY